MKPKIIYSNSGTLTDFSVEANDYYGRTAAIPIAITTDYLFIGSLFPFNHFYYKADTANTETATLTVEYFDSTLTWRSVVELNDETLSSGKTLAQDGFISFVPNKNYTWAREDTQDANGNERVTGLGNVNIYDRYWLRISVSASLSAGTILEWLGNIFSNDSDLGSEFPDLVLSDTMTAFKTGKTNWEEQHVRAAGIIIKDLKKMKSINSSSQILDKQDFTFASIFKVAEIAYRAFGSAFDQQRLDATKEYKSRLNGITAAIDENSNGIIDNNESNVKSTLIIR